MTEGSVRSCDRKLPAGFGVIRIKESRNIESVLTPWRATVSRARGRLSYLRGSRRSAVNNDATLIDLWKTVSWTGHRDDHHDRFSVACPNRRKETGWMHGAFIFYRGLHTVRRLFFLTRTRTWIYMVICDTCCVREFMIYVYSKLYLKKCTRTRCVRVYIRSDKDQLEKNT